MLEKFKEYLDYLNEKEVNSVNIVMHNNPDPDSIGSAVGIKLILSNQNISSTIYYSGSISHPQNKTLVNVLGISMQKTQDEILENVICVDCTPLNSCAKQADLIIDHHTNEYSDALYSIEDNMVGACCTIVWELIKDFKLNIIKKEDIEKFTVFTALLLGIRTDTNDLISENISKKDFIAYQELLDVSDKESLQKIMNYPLPKFLYDTRISLYKEGNTKENNGVFIGGVGYIPDDYRDAIAILAEEYCRMESITTAVIFAIVDKRNLQISVRSSNVSLDVGAMCNDLFGGGGATYKGGATVDLDFFKEVSNGDKEKLWELVRKLVFKKVLKENWQETEHEE